VQSYILTLEIESNNQQLRNLYQRWLDCPFFICCPVSTIVNDSLVYASSKVSVPIEYLNGKSSSQLKRDNFQYVATKSAMKTQLSFIMNDKHINTTSPHSTTAAVYTAVTTVATTYLWHFSYSDLKCSPLGLIFSKSNEISIRPLNMRSAWPVSGGPRNYERGGGRKFISPVILCCKWT